MQGLTKLLGKCGFEKQLCFCSVGRLATHSPGGDKNCGLPFVQVCVSKEDAASETSPPGMSAHRTVANREKAARSYQLICHVHLLFQSNQLRVLSWI